MVVLEMLVLVVVVEILLEVVLEMLVLVVVVVKT